MCPSIGTVNRAHGDWWSVTRVWLAECGSWSVTQLRRSVAQLRRTTDERRPPSPATRGNDRQLTGGITANKTSVLYRCFVMSGT